MVYIPWEVAERYMLHKWEEALKENPRLPRPTKTDINIKWFQWLDWVPSSSLELGNFVATLPYYDRGKVQFRMVSEYKRQPVKRKLDSTPIAQPLGDEPKR